jgi:hypothetical protein
MAARFPSIITPADIQKFVQASDSESGQVDAPAILKEYIDAGKLVVLSAEILENEHVATVVAAYLQKFLER